VKAGSVRNAANTILATEIWGSQPAVQTDSLNGGGEKVSASRRPLNGFTVASPTRNNLYKVPPNGTFYKATLNDLGKDPEVNVGASPTTLLDWVGRNHGRKKRDSQGYDNRLSNFLFVDATSRRNT